MSLRAPNTGGHGDGPQIKFFFCSSLVVKTCTFSNKNSICPLCRPKVAEARDMLNVKNSPNMDQSGPSPYIYIYIEKTLSLSIYISISIYLFHLYVSVSLDLCFSFSDANCHRPNPAFSWELGAVVRKGFFLIKFSSSKFSYYIGGFKKVLL